MNEFENSQKRVRWNVLLGLIAFAVDGDRIAAIGGLSPCETVEKFITATEAQPVSGLHCLTQDEREALKAFINDIQSATTNVDLTGDFGVFRQSGPGQHLAERAENTILWLMKNGLPKCHFEANDK